MYSHIISRVSSASSPVSVRVTQVVESVDARKLLFTEVDVFVEVEIVGLGQQYFLMNDSRCDRTDK